TEGLAIGQFETADLADNLDDALEPLDVAFIGSLDLSIAAGRPGEPSAREVRALIERVERSAHRIGRHLGIFAANPSAAREAVASGYRYVAVSADLSLLRQGGTDLVDAVRRP
ncbi:MAG: aldolase/citrate lyase family protein, partial [Acidimicrobiales bacterium]